MEIPEIPPNYRYWQENGAYWVDEYSRRKKNQVYYDIQEFLLAEYFGRCAPARVLEFGCGVGRHIKYLREIPGIEIHGYDQSSSMLDGIHQWADKKWFEEHITLGEPVTRLPYDDKSFDIVFTAEVLIHVRPEDLNMILGEFLRITKWQIFHLEPALDFIVASDEHYGCWNHDLVQAYTNLGYPCEQLPKGYLAQSPYRVILDQSRSLPLSIISMSKLMELENDIQPTLDNCEKYSSDLVQIRKQYEVMKVDRDRLWDEVQMWSRDAAAKEKAYDEMRVDRDRLWEEVHMWSKQANAKENAYEEMKGDRNRLWNEVKMTRDELNQIYASRSYRIFQRIRESTLGGVTIRWLKQLLARKTQIQASIKSTLSPKIYELPDQSPNNMMESVPPPKSPSTQSGASEFTLPEREWLEKVTQSPQPLSVQHPEWLGIHHSAEQLFNSLFDLENNLDETKGMHYARLFIEAQPTAIVLQGYPLTYYYLIEALKKVRPQIPIYIIWHGSFMQAGEDLDWSGFLQVDHLCRSGMVQKVGFIKKGMAETVAKTGLRTAFVMNYMRQIPNTASTPLADGPHFGLWSIQPIWRKLPFAMLAALSTIQNAKVYCAGQDRRALDFANYFKINIQTSAFIPYKLALKKMSEMDLNLYITMSETSGMVTLESLSVGTPCLFGPNTHYFEDQPYLLSRLMVNYPERSEVIAKYIEQALSEREQIITTYIQYAPGYNTLARKLLSEFLDMEIN